MTDLGTRALVLACGAALDLILGDPRKLWHPVIGFGWLISRFETLLFRIFRLSGEPEADRGRKRAAGALLTVLVLTVAAAAYFALRFLLGLTGSALPLLLDVIVTWQMLAMTSLRRAAEDVRRPLAEGDTEAARKAVSMVVGRDTASLTAEGITKAAVETVAENASDGVIAPLFYLFLFGPAGGWVYKCINTMDSMIGYRNDRYRYFGTAAARLDDAANFLPSRLAALAIVAGAWLLEKAGRRGSGGATAGGFTGYDAANAWRIHRRDRFNHPSPNSAQTESAVAGALHIRLAGDAWYFGVLHHKPTQGDADRPVEPEDIRRTERLMEAAAGLVFAAGELILMAISLALM